MGDGLFLSDGTMNPNSYTAKYAKYQSDPLYYGQAYFNKGSTDEQTTLDDSENALSDGTINQKISDEWNSVYNTSNQNSTQDNTNYAYGTQQNGFLSSYPQSSSSMQSISDYLTNYNNNPYMQW